MKKLTLLILCSSIVMFSFADNYKILRLNTKTIKIGNRICKVGDVFSSSEVIHWSMKKQAFRAINQRTQTTRFFAEPEFQAKKCKTIDFFIKNNRTSSREGMDFDELKELLSEPLYLMDELAIESPIYPTTDQQYFYIAYHQKGETVCHRIPLHEGKLIISRSMFPSKIDEVIVTIAYHKDGIAEDYIISNGVKIVIIPLLLK